MDRHGATQPANRCEIDLNHAARRLPAQGMQVHHMCTYVLPRRGGIDAGLDLDTPPFEINYRVAHGRGRLSGRAASPRARV